jgi:Concanavalin A-like lectin/glucanases superfamily
MAHAHRLTAALPLVALAACALGVRLPEGRIVCAADTDCPPDWVCRLPEGDTAGLCYRTPADGDAGAVTDTGDAGSQNGDAAPAETRDAGAEPDAGALAPSDSGAGDAGEAGDAGNDDDAGSRADGSVGAAPNISAITLTRSAFSSGESFRVTCLASDPDDDPLTYAWSSLRGSFDAPDQRSSLYTTGPVGPEALTCAVDDGHGNTARATGEVRVYPTELVTYLPFGISSDGADASGQNRFGSVSDGTYVADRAGVPSAALELSGTGSVTVADPAAFASSSWSFVATLRPTARGGTIMTKQGASGFGSYGLFLYAGSDSSLPGRLQYYQQAGNNPAPYVAVLGSFTARADVFFQLAVTRSAAGELHAYVDGTEIAVERNLPPSVANDAPLVLGSGLFGDFSGVIDEVQFYARVLDPSEVTALTELQ